MAQEWVRLSQAPVLSRSGEYRLMNRTVSLRVFAVATGDGNYHVMPGGLTRVAPRQRRDVVSMQQGGTSKDVWILSETAADAESSSVVPVDAGADDISEVIQATVDISSHAGENLFWMGRYGERTDNLAHILRTTLQATSDSQNRGTLQSVTALCRNLGILPAELVKPSINTLQQALQLAVTDPEATISIATHLRHLHHSGYQVREHLSLDNWHVINRMPALLNEKIHNPNAALQVLNNVMQACSALAGHAMDDMTRDEGWQFLMVGRHIERMAHLANLFDQFLQLDAERQNAALSWLLEAASSIVTYRVRYRRTPEWLPVLHLLVFDVSNPHSIAYQFRMLRHYLSDIALQLGTLSMSVPEHLSEQLNSFVLQDFARAAANPEEANARLIQLMREAVASAFTLTDDLARHFFTPLTAPVSQGV